MLPVGGGRGFVLLFRHVKSALANDCTRDVSPTYVHAIVSRTRAKGRAPGVLGPVDFRAGWWCGQP